MEINLVASLTKSQEHRIKNQEQRINNQQNNL